MHHVSSSLESSLAVPEALLSDHVDYLVRRGYVGLTFGEAERRRQDEVLPRRSVVVTFDDGFASVLRAKPILDAAGFPATVFAVTRFVEAETDLWKVITGVFRRREREQVDDAIARIERIVSALRAIENPSPADTFTLARVQQLHAFFRLGRRFLEAFVTKNPVSGLLKSIAQHAAKFRGLSPLSEHDAPFGH